jgi:arginine:agmatine antiporter
MSASGQRIGLFRATMLVAGNMIGSGVFLMPASMAPNGGISLLGWLVAVPCALLLAVVFARLATRRPMAGGPYAWARWGLGDYPASSCNSLYWMGLDGQRRRERRYRHFGNRLCQRLSTYPGRTARCSRWHPRGDLLAVAANVAGPRLVSSIESATALFGLLPVVAIASLGWWWFQGGLFAANGNPSGLSPFAAVRGALTIMFWAFTGVESAAVATEVLENPSRNVARATLLGVAASACAYVGSTAVIFGPAPADQIAKSPAPFETAVAAAVGAGPALIMAFCAVVKAAGALGGWTLLTAESARASAQDRLFARVFARVDSRGVPVAGLVVVGILMTALEMFALAPSFGGLFSRWGSVSTLLIIPAYLFSAIALSLDNTECRSMRLVGVAAAIAAISVAAAANTSDALLALVLVLVTAPLCVLNQRAGQAAPHLVADHRRSPASQIAPSSATTADAQPPSQP